MISKKIWRRKFCFSFHSVITLVHFINNHGRLSWLPKFFKSHSKNTQRQAYFWCESNCNSSPGINKSLYVRFGLFWCLHSMCISISPSSLPGNQSINLINQWSWSWNSWKKFIQSSSIKFILRVQTRSIKLCVKLTMSLQMYLLTIRLLAIIRNGTDKLETKLDFL